MAAIRRPRLIGQPAQEGQPPDATARDRRSRPLLKRPPCMKKGAPRQGALVMSPILPPQAGRAVAAGLRREKMRAIRTKNTGTKISVSVVPTTVPKNVA